MPYDKLNKYLEKKGLNIAVEANKAKKEKLKGKAFTTLSTKEKDELLERIANDLGYL